MILCNHVYIVGIISVIVFAISYYYTCCYYVLLCFLLLITIIIMIIMIIIKYKTITYVYKWQNEWW